MGKNKKESFFWTSYSDLMTSLFFVMLVLFILTIALLHNKITATQGELDKIKELNTSIQKIDKQYFQYDSTFKRHTIKDIDVSFQTNSSNINDLTDKDLNKLYSAGGAIRRFMLNAQAEIPEAEYMLIIEGQSSKDDYVHNYELSYARALSLVKFWVSKGIQFDDLPCELIISGSGQSSKFRNQPDNASNKSNQRFVIHIIPKPGILISSGKNQKMMPDETQSSSREMKKQERKKSREIIKRNRKELREGSSEESSTLTGLP